MRPSHADKTEWRRLFPACAWRLPPLSEAKARLLCPKTSLSLRVVVCFPPLWHGPTHFPGREVFPGCFSFLPGEFLASRAALGSSGTGSAQVALQTALFIALRCRLDAASSVTQANVHSRADAPWLRQACPKNARQDLDTRLPAEPPPRHLGRLMAMNQAKCWVLVCYLVLSRYWGLDLGCSSPVLPHREQGFGNTEHFHCWDGQD